MKTIIRPANRSEALVNRRFGTTDLAIVMGLWSAMAVLLGGVLSELTSDTETPMAKAQSEAYATQLAQDLDTVPKMGPSTNGTKRGPASIHGLVESRAELRNGTLGKDPWGHAYQYKVVPEGVIVWSQGKNSECDSTDALNRLEEGQSLHEFHFSGDDVGFVIARHKAH